MWREAGFPGARAGVFLFLVFGAAVHSTGAIGQGWPRPAVRTGSTIPGERELAVTLLASGAYVPKSDPLAMGETGILEGSLIWNLGLSRQLALFGEHTVGGIWWGNVTVLTLGHEAGLRFVGNRFFVLEAAYLSHRYEQEWIETGDGDMVPWAVGNVRDRGLEIGSWLRFDPMDRLRVEVHMVGRLFRLYKRTQGAHGLGLRTSILITGGQSIVTEIELLRVTRNDPRPGVDITTWNILGIALWQLEISRKFGIQIGARASTNMLCGEVPMFEIKRSVINEKMGLVLAGFNFFV